MGDQTALAMRRLLSARKLSVFTVAEVRGGLRRYRVSANGIYQRWGILVMDGVPGKEEDCLQRRGLRVLCKLPNIRIVMVILNMWGDTFNCKHFKQRGSRHRLPGA